MNRIMIVSVSGKYNPSDIFTEEYSNLEVGDVINIGRYGYGGEGTAEKAELQLKIKNGHSWIKNSQKFFMLFTIQE